MDRVLLPSLRETASAAGTRRLESVKLGPKSLRLAASGALISTLDPLSRRIFASFSSNGRKRVYDAPVGE